MGTTNVVRLATFLNWATGVTFAALLHLEPTANDMSRFRFMSLAFLLAGLLGLAVTSALAGQEKRLARLEAELARRGPAEQPPPGGDGGP
jgi:hypothetical protein